MWYYKDEGILYMDIKALSGESAYSGKIYPEVKGGPNNDYGWTIVGGDRDKLIKDGGQRGLHPSAGSQR